MATFIIANGTAISNSVKMSEKNVACGLFAYAAFTSASFTLEVSIDGGVNFVTVRDQSGSATFTTDTVNGDYYVINPNISAGFGNLFLRIRTASNEGAERKIELITRTII